MNPVCGLCCFAQTVILLIKFLQWPTADETPGLAPLFEVQLNLQVPDIVFHPSLEFGAADGFCDLVEGLINDIFRISSLVPRLAEYSSFPHYQVLPFLQ